MSSITGDAVDVQTPNLTQAGTFASRYPPHKWLKFAEQPCLEQKNSSQLDIK